LLEWLNQDLKGSRVIITHNAPVINPNTKYDNSPLMPAFNSLDMRKIIQKYQPNLWIYGHTHECDNQLVGDTRIISNQLGYPGHSGGFECSDFDINGIIISIK
jgi:Icc-related predicted phosphoesterase